MFIGGGQVGFNYQFSTLVVGLESEFEGIGNNNHSRGVLVPALGDTFAITSNDRWLALVTARLGVAYNNWLFYGKGGGGWIGNGSLTLTASQALDEEQARQDRIAASLREVAELQRTATRQTQTVRHRHRRRRCSQILYGAARGPGCECGRRDNQQALGPRRGVDGTGAKANRGTARAAEATRPQEMTTITIIGADRGRVLATNGTLTALHFASWWLQIKAT
jgi:hypothetical protein